MPNEFLSSGIVPIGLIAIMIGGIWYAANNWSNSRVAGLSLSASALAFFISWFFWTRTLWEYVLFENFLLFLALAVPGLLLGIAVLIKNGNSGAAWIWLRRAVTRIPVRVRRRTNP